MVDCLMSIVWWWVCNVECVMSSVWCHVCDVECVTLSVWRWVCDVECVMLSVWTWSVLRRVCNRILLHDLLYSLCRWRWALSGGSLAGSWGQDPGIPDGVASLHCSPLPGYRYYVFKDPPVTYRRSSKQKMESFCFNSVFLLLKSLLNKKFKI